MAKHEDPSGGHAGEGALTKDELKLHWKAKRPYQKSCPETPGEYCTENRDWSVEVMLWLLEADASVRDCCGTDVAGPAITLTATTCASWQDAWGTLHDFGMDIKEYLKDLETAVEDCTGEKIRRPRPVPRRRQLPNKEERHRAVACRRARHYTKRFKKWGDEITEAFNDHCHDEHPTHLSPPPDPPF